MNPALVTDEMLAGAVSGAGLSGGDMRPGPIALASPSYKALESASVFVTSPDGPRFIKVMHPEMSSTFDLATADMLAVAAGRAGVGPHVTWSDPTQGAIAMEALTEKDGWRTANQHCLQSPAVLASAMAMIRTLHKKTSLKVNFNPFTQIDVAIGGADRTGAPLPDDTLWLRRLVAQIEPMALGVKRVPCRNDGSASNILVGPGDTVLLIDFDRAGLNDPLYDVGVLLAEVTDFESDMKAGYMAYAGDFDEAGFARARLWSFVDDMLHAVWARQMAHGSVRTGLEWLKYSEWRFMRLRMALNHPQFEEKLRTAGVIQ